VAIVDEGHAETRFPGIARARDWALVTHNMHRGNPEMHWFYGLLELSWGTRLGG